MQENVPKAAISAFEEQRRSSNPTGIIRNSSSNAYMTLDVLQNGTVVEHSRTRGAKISLSEQKIIKWREEKSE